MDRNQLAGTTYKKKKKTKKNKANCKSKTDQRHRPNTGHTSDRREFLSTKDQDQKPSMNKPAGKQSTGNPLRPAGKVLTAR